VTSGTTETGSDVENARATRQRGERGELDRRVAPASVKLVDGCEVVDRECVESLAGGSERTANVRHQLGNVVLRFDLFVGLHGITLRRERRSGVDRASIGRRIARW